MKQNVWLPGNSYSSIAEVLTCWPTLLTAWRLFRKHTRTLCCWTTHACHLKWSRKTLVWPVTPQLPLWVHPSKFITPGEELEPSFSPYIHTLSMGFAVVITVVVLSTTHEQQRIKRKSLDSLDFLTSPGAPEILFSLKPKICDPWGIAQRVRHTFVNGVTASFDLLVTIYWKYDLNYIL